MNLIKSYIVYNVSGTVPSLTVSVDGVTIQGDGSSANPLAVIAGVFDPAGSAAAAQAAAIQRANHTGTQTASTISDFNTAVASTAALKANNLSDLANAATARTNLGATTVGGNIFTLTNPGAIRLLRVNADNTVTAIDASEFIGVACSDETTVLGAASTSVPVATFHVPYAMTLTRVFAGLRTAGTGASQCIVDIHVNGVTIMSVTKILFSASVKLSADGTLTTTALAAGDYVEIFLDQRDTNNVATGLKTYLVGYK